MNEKKINNTSTNYDYFSLIFLTFTCLNIFWMCNLRIYPFIDVPNHLALATIIKFYGEATNAFKQYYSIDMFLKPNTFHPLFCGLNIFPSIEIGNKIFYCLYVLLFPLSVLLIIKKLNGNKWFSILSFLLIYNFNVMWGFVGFTISIPFILFLLYFLIDSQYSNNLWNKAVLAILFIILFFMHALACIFSLFFFFVFCLYYHRTSLLKILKESIVTIPALVLITQWWVIESVTRSSAENYYNKSILNFIIHYYQTEYFKYLKYRGNLFFLDNYFLYDGLTGRFISFLFVLFIIIISLYQLILNRKALYNDFMNKKNEPALIFMACSFFCYLIIPLELPDYSLLSERFSVFCLISIIILGSVISPKKPKKMKIFIIYLVCSLHFILWSDYFYDFQKENYFFTKNLFPENSKNKKLAGLIYDNNFRGNPIYSHFMDYYIVWKNGIASVRFIDAKSFAVRRKVSKELLPPYFEWGDDGAEYDGRYANMDYILVRGRLDKKLSSYLEDFKLVKAVSEWSLYERKTLLNLSLKSVQKVL